MTAKNSIIVKHIDSDDSDAGKMIFFPTRDHSKWNEYTLVVKHSMLNIPSSILLQYETLLRRRSVPTDRHPLYIKWLQYYLDFCGRYRHSADSSSSMLKYLAKLREKKQVDAAVRLASHAISFYLEDIDNSNIF